MDEWRKECGVAEQRLLQKFPKFQPYKSVCLIWVSELSCKENELWQVMAYQKYKNGGWKKNEKRNKVDEAGGEQEAEQIANFRATVLLKGNGWWKATSLTCHNVLKEILSPPPTKFSTLNALICIHFTAILISLCFKHNKNKIVHQ